jgi:hypothetical protein
MNQPQPRSDESSRLSGIRYAGIPDLLTDIPPMQQGEAMDLLNVIFGFIAAFGFGPLVSLVGLQMMREGLRAMGYW